MKGVWPYCTTGRVMCKFSNLDVGDWFGLEIWCQDLCVPAEANA
jgi:hypothetical protein